MTQRLPVCSWICSKCWGRNACFASSLFEIKGLNCAYREIADISFRSHGLHIAHLGRTRMPWKECKPMDERLRFIARLLEGEQMASLCRQFGISRVTGYKIFERYKE